MVPAKPLIAIRRHPHSFFGMAIVLCFHPINHRRRTTYGADRFLVARATGSKSDMWPNQVGFCATLRNWCVDLNAVKSQPWETWGLSDKLPGTNSPNSAGTKTRLARGRDVGPARALGLPSFSFAPRAQPRASLRVPGRHWCFCFKELPFRDSSAYPRPIVIPVSSLSGSWSLSWYGIGKILANGVLSRATRQRLSPFVLRLFVGQQDRRCDLERIQFWK